MHETHVQMTRRCLFVVRCVSAANHGLHTSVILPVLVHGRQQHSLVKCLQDLRDILILSVLVAILLIGA